jgi:hypothetical protein
VVGVGVHVEGVMDLVVEVVLVVHVEFLLILKMGQVVVVWVEEVVGVHVLLIPPKI